MNYSKLKVKFFDSKEIGKDDILWGLLELGIDVECPKFEVELQVYSEEELDELIKYLSNTDIVFTQNFSACMAEACHRLNIKYISWVYDSPQRALYLKEACYETNYIFVFDKEQKKRLEEIGVRNLYYSPLAANIRKAAQIKISKEDNKKYTTEVSFVGSLYNREYLDVIVQSLPDDILQKLVNYLEQTCYVWNNDTIYNHADGELVNYIYNLLDHSDLELYNLSHRFLVEILIFVPMIAREERVEGLRIISQHNNVKLFTRGYEGGYDLGNTAVAGPVDINSDMFKVFKLSKLNLNFTMRGIESGVPQRVFDIMAIGGACISNYQKEAEELFVPDKEIILFHDLDELKEKTDFYLKHEEDRKKIALNGYKKVQQCYSYPILLKKILDTVLGE